MNSLIYGHVTRPSPFIFVTKQKLKTVLFCIPLPYSWIALLLRSVSFGSTSADTAKTQFCRNFVISSKENSQIYTKLSADHNSSYSCVGRGPTSEPIIRWNKSGFLASITTELKENWDSGKRTSMEPPYQLHFAIKLNLRVMPATFCRVILK